MGQVINLSAKSIDMNAVNWQKVGGMLPAIVQDYQSSEVLMLGYMTKEALQKTIVTGKVTFFSRSQRKLWTKGETSGNFLSVVEMALDCDDDTLLVLANPTGPTCHLNRVSCFEEVSKNSQWVFFSRLEKMLEERKDADSSHSYTAKLYQSGTKRIAQKVGEEGVEVALAGVSKDKEELLNESADLLYHLTVLLKDQDLTWSEVISVLKERH